MPGGRTASSPFLGGSPFLTGRVACLSGPFLRKVSPHVFSVPSLVVQGPFAFPRFPGSSSLLRPHRSPWPLRARIAPSATVSVAPVGIVRPFRTAAFVSTSRRTEGLPGSLCPPNACVSSSLTSGDFHPWLPHRRSGSPSPVCWLSVRFPTTRRLALAPFGFGVSPDTLCCTRPFGWLRVLALSRSLWFSQFLDFIVFLLGGHSCLARSSRKLRI